ncbi:MAG TPA: phosphopantetheine-binding protein, partial [Ktedonobacteraceae bacterium]
SQVWQEILARKTIGLSEDFFNIGGDSLKATQIVSRLSLLFQTEISLLTFLDKPTIAELAAEIEDLLLADDDF